MKRRYKKELKKLAMGLIDKGIAFKFHELYNGGQIVTDTWDAVCHDFSYGHERGELEVYVTDINSLGDLGDCDVKGYLTARDILDRLEA